MTGPDRLAVGDRVVVRTTLADPAQLECHPHTIVAEVVDGPTGSTYFVAHGGTFQARRFGPFTRERLRAGW